MTNFVKIKRALISVSDKTGLIEFAKQISDLGIEILSTGGTSKTLEKSNIKTTEISEITDYPEILDGRVKTLHPNIHGGLLADKKNLKHLNTLQKFKIPEIDLLVVNLYPFEKTVDKKGNEEECIENIDIGGPAMIRAASKNYKNVTVVIDQKDYRRCILELKNNNRSTSLKFRKSLAQFAFSYTSRYDCIISNWMKESFKINSPKILNISGTLKKELRYGENPHQKASVYLNNDPFFLKLHGKDLSYNNICDMESAFNIVNAFKKQNKLAASIIKHANPCGVAVAENGLDAYKKAFLSDPISAFGGIVSLNTDVNLKIASEIVKTYTEVILAPNFSDDALKFLKDKKNLRLIKFKNDDSLKNEKIFKSLVDGFLIQDSDKLNSEGNDFLNFKVVTKMKPSKEEIEDLSFAFETVKYVKSNGIVIAKGKCTLGIGAGQTSRVDSVFNAKRKTILFSKRNKTELKNLVLASDAFFPFPDSISEIVDLGVTSIIQPGGSIRDEEIIKASNDAGISMIFTGKRYFLH